MVIPMQIMEIRANAWQCKKPASCAGFHRVFRRNHRLQAVIDLFDNDIVRLYFLLEKVAVPVPLPSCDKDTQYEI
jgi:hypothetical protein